MSVCEMCGKPLVTDGSDDLALDCGGDCWECMLHVESAPGVAEYALGWRDRARAAMDERDRLRAALEELHADCDRFESLDSTGLSHFIDEALEGS